MALPNAFLEELRARLRPSEVVGRRVRLTRNGREFIGLCPFHDEKTPSFTVNDDKGFYHCFGCGAHGSVIDFEMEQGGLSFREAVEQLASQAGLQMPREDPQEAERENRRAGLREVMEAACRWFERQLHTAPGAEARRYLLEARGLTQATVQHYRLGYAPGGRGVLRDALQREGITEDQLVEAGLLIRPEDGGQPYDRFRDRVIFPITDRRGRVVAFGGRLLGDGRPKYLNSPETPLFRKGEVLYGLAQAREAARNAGRVVVAEGYMDVLALAQAGVQEAVAPLGTALTEDQIDGLWRLAPEPVLCFDGDDAGQRAAARAAERALPRLRPGVTLRFALLPAGEDPDTLVQRRGARALHERLDNADALVDVLWRSLRQAHRLDTPEARARLERAADDMAGRVGDRTVGEHYRRALRDRFFQALRDQRGTGRSGGGRRGRSGNTGERRPQAPATPPAAPPDGRTIRGRLMLATVLLHPGIFDSVGERLGTLGFHDPALDKLRQEVIKRLSEASGLDSATLCRHLRDLGYGSAVDSLLAEATSIHAAFAHPEADPETARAGWEHLYDLCHWQALEADLQQAGERLAADMSENTLQHLQNLLDEKQQAARDPETESRHDIPGKGS